MSTREKGENRKRLIKRTEDAVNGEVNAVNMSRFLKVYDLIFEFLVLSEGVRIPAMMRNDGMVVEEIRHGDLVFLEERLVGDFVRERLDTRRFVDWALKNGLKRPLSRALRPFQNPK